MPALTLIFDMDGVLIDSNPLHREAWLLYNRRFGIETDDAMQERMYGRRNDEIIRDFFGSELTGDEVSAHGAAKERLYREMMAPRLQESLVPGIADFLQRRQGGLHGLGSNAEPANIDFLLDNTGLRSHFHAVVDGHQVSRPKPDPEVYLKVADLLGAHPCNCVVFEDSFAGVDAARAAGMRVVALRTTHNQFMNVDLTVDHFQCPELEVWLQRQNARI